MILEATSVVFAWPWFFFFGKGKTKTENKQKGHHYNFECVGGREAPMRTCWAPEILTNSVILP